MALELDPENLTPSTVNAANYPVVDQIDFVPRPNGSTTTYLASTRTTVESTKKALIVGWQSIPKSLR